MMDQEKAAWTGQSPTDAKRTPLTVTEAKSRLPSSESIIQENWESLVKAVEDYYQAEAPFTPLKGLSENFTPPDGLSLDEYNAQRKVVAVARHQVNKEFLDNHSDTAQEILAALYAAASERNTHIGKIAQDADAAKETARKCIETILPPSPLGRPAKGFSDAAYAFALDVIPTVDLQCMQARAKPKANAITVDAVQKSEEKHPRTITPSGLLPLDYYVGFAKAHPGKDNRYPLGFRRHLKAVYDQEDAQLLKEGKYTEDERLRTVERNKKLWFLSRS